MHARSEIVLAFALVVAPAFGVYAQSPHHIAAGPFLGTSSTKFYGGDGQGFTTRRDLSAGVQLDFDVGAHAWCRTGLLYSGRGAKISEQGVDFEIETHYIELPLTLGYRLRGAGLRPYVAGGAQIGFKTGCTVRGTTSTGESDSIACNDPGFGAHFTSTDVALLGAGGLFIPVGTTFLSFDARYAHGLMKVERDSKLRNRGLTLGVGLTVPVGR